MSAPSPEGQFESDPSRWRRAVKRSRIIAPLAGLSAMAVLKLGAAAAESPVLDVTHPDSPNVPARSSVPESSPDLLFGNPEFGSVGEPSNLRELVYAKAELLKKERERAAGHDVSEGLLSQREVNLVEGGLVTIPEQLAEPLTQQTEAELRIRDYFIRWAERSLGWSEPAGLAGPIPPDVADLSDPAETVFNAWATRGLARGKWDPRLEIRTGFSAAEISDLLELKQIALANQSQAETVADQLYGPSNVAQDRSDGRIGDIPLVEVPFHTERLRRAEQFAVKYWKRFGYDQPCHGDPHTLLTNLFDQPDGLTYSPSGAAQESSCTVWYKSAAAVTGNQRTLDWVTTHEDGHLLGLGHSHDQRSVMYSAHRPFTPPPPERATNDYFYRLFKQIHQRSH